MFEPRATQRQLAQLSRNLGVSLTSGVPIVRAFELSARKLTGVARSVLDDIVVEIKSGSDVASALAAHRPFFPELFIDMVRVGEETGALAEVFHSLARHYEDNLRLKKEFVSQITLPVVQLLAAIFIIAGLIYLLGWVASMTGMTVDVLGWGLLGAPGALLWLGGWALFVAALYFGYRFLSATLEGQRTLHRFLLGVPVVGNCLRAFAIARFSWAFHLTQEAGMGIDESLESSFKATGNGAFQAAAADVIVAVNSGETLTDALSESQLFPIEFIETVLVAETSGTVPESLHRLSPQFEEDARRSLGALATAAGWLIWGAVAGFIVFLIFTIVFWYLGMLNDALRGANGL